MGRTEVMRSLDKAVRALQRRSRSVVSSCQNSGRVLGVSVSALPLSSHVRTLQTMAITDANADVDPRRQEVSIYGRSPIVSSDCYVAPSATVIGQVEIHDKVGIGYNTVLRGDMNPITIGFSSHIKDCCVICVDASLAAGYDASTVIGNFVSIGSRCYLKACTIQDEVTIGDGCIVQEGALIETGAVLEAGSVVPAGARVPAAEVWGGNPLSFVRKLHKDELEAPGYAAKANWELAYRHKDEFLPNGQAYQALK